MHIPKFRVEKILKLFKKKFYLTVQSKLLKKNNWVISSSIEKLKKKNYIKENVGRDQSMERKREKLRKSKF